MNLKVGFLIIVYYSIISLVLIFGSSIFLASEYTSNININDSSLSSGEIESGGLFDTGVSFTRFFTIIGFGIGLPDDTPTGFVIFFAIWQTTITILAIMWIISSIWDG